MDTVRISKRAVFVLAAASLASMASIAAFAQNIPGPANAQRDCQTLRTCQFSKGGSFRGCLSSYSCRSCRFVPAKCSVGGTSGACQRQVCDWGA
jgi:hypothetical protein